MSRAALVLAGLVVAGVAAIVVPSLVKHDDAPAVATIASAAVPAPPTHSEWCGDDFESLPSDVCYVNGRDGGERKTLVIWLHGVIGKTTHWSLDHLKLLSRVSKATKLELLFPKGIAGAQAYEWPQTPASLAENEDALIQQWMTAKQALEQREGRKFDQTFIFGFSSGAYFASSMALRGKADVDGYAVFAGGQAKPAAATPITHFAPVFVGICADDPTGTAAHGRAFASSLPATIPHAASEEPVGHDLSPTHFTKALAFLRKQGG